MTVEAFHIDKKGTVLVSGRSLATGHLIYRSTSVFDFKTTLIMAGINPPTEEELIGLGVNPPTPPGEKPPDAESKPEVPDYVTLFQAAKMVKKSKRTLEGYKTKGSLPAPVVEGGGGQADLYDWAIMRPWLADTFGFNLDQLPLVHPDTVWLRARPSDRRKPPKTTP
jgi:hypothetical protein